jgi:hypothetical protein
MAELARDCIVGAVSSTAGEKLERPKVLLRASSAGRVDARSSNQTSSLPEIGWTLVRPIPESAVSMFDTRARSKNERFRPLSPSSW